ncbi:hypothetical protein MPH_10336 [Macrophomina phaseolina MS6]|uniref:histidine kinase n=1 Tax=Macrophomina phaseolina (strain MS6) TaxID=1126212 RepID=K2QRR4_MACPH|nr:hypothetical protein MPH_10336 [Macrophomina phaseolina MS6]
MGPHQSESAAAAAAASITDSSRARELYKYFQPPRPPYNTVSVTRSGVPCTVLTAHAQLVAWRLNAQRALVSLIDRETQYFVAESTKTLDLANSEEYEAPNDAVWAGCVSVPKAGRLCEHTIEQSPSPDGSPACFEVLDLTKDERFNSLPFVAGEPHFKYYVGVPLRTKKGIPIGSLFAMDDRVREPLNESARKFLGIMASNVMEHLELMKEKEDRKRAVNMNMCLAAFVDPEHHSRRRKRKLHHHRSRSLRHATFAEHKAARSVRGEEDTESITSPKLPSAPRSNKSSGRRSNASRRQEEQDSMESSEESEAENSSRVGDDDHIETFERASKGLFESLSLRSGGGVVFMSTTAGLRPDGTPMPSVKPSMDDMKGRAAQHRDSVGGMTEHSVDGSPTFADSGHSVEILAQVESPAIDQDDQGARRRSFMPLPPGDLAKLIKRHPRGKLYSFGDDGLSQGSSGEESLSADYYSMPASARRRLPSKSEAVILAKHFPGARQIIFIPLWDVQIESWVACFAYNTSDFRTFSHNPDFLHSIAFCSCVMTEVARLATIAADQQKSDFIGSISHELRSPLHGILASCEFLEDTECSSYQKALVSTADSCARTLLDTINMVLDYSKINSFERNIRKARKSRKESIAPNAIPMMQQPSLNIYDAIDLAAITEEVVAGVALGHVFRDITTFEGQDDRMLLPSPNRNLGGLGDGQSMPVKRPDVEILMNIEARRWDFVTQPGAFRRIVMNLFGNAIKYTKQGFIKVSLTAKDIKDQPLQRVNTNQDPPATSIVTLTIADSGQGISPEYLRTKLFTPFAQESPLNPGTGLGLSLVRSIVDMLNGEINIRSALGVGTEVVVTLPMVKGGSSGTNSTTTPASVPASSAGSLERPILSSVSNVKERACGMAAALFRSSDLDAIQNPVTIRALEIARESLVCFLRDWYGFSSVVDWHPDAQVDLIAVDEVDLPKLIEACPSLNSNLADGPMLIVIRASASKHSVTDELMKHVHLEYLSRPVGPYKLARALQNVLDRRTKKSAGSVADSAVSPNTTEMEIPLEEVVTHIEQIALETVTDEPETIGVLHKGNVLGNEESMNAHMALDTVPPPDAVPAVERNEAFPFPDPPPAATSLEDGQISPSFIPPHDRPHFGHNRTMSWTPQERLSYEAPPSSPMSAQGAAMSSPPPKNRTTSMSSRDTSTTPTPRRCSLSFNNNSNITSNQHHQPTHSPRLLLVDDNAVNLRLLQTFMRKRHYTSIHSAADGAQAVAVFSSLLAAATPPDIVFMDISMPTMNGFEATRRIRAIEADFAAGKLPHERYPPSLIVALTGLASGRDQSEAFTSGFDLYMTKPRMGSRRFSVEEFKAQEA